MTTIVSSTHTDRMADPEMADIIDAAMTLSPRMGWTDDMIEQAAVMAGHAPSALMVIAPNGPVDILCHYLSHRTDQAIEHLELQGGIRDKIRSIIMARFELMIPDIPAIERGMGMLHHPKNISHGVRRAYDDADHTWQAVGDTATDYNRYTKRILLARILIKTMPVFLTHADDMDYVSADVQQRLDRTVKIGGWLGKSVARMKSVIGRANPLS